MSGVARKQPGFEPGHRWGSGSHEVAFKKGQSASTPPDVWSARELRKTLPRLAREALRGMERRVHYDQTRLICVRCEYVPKQKNKLRLLEGRGYVCVDYGPCEKRQVAG